MNLIAILIFLAAFTVAFLVDGHRNKMRARRKEAKRWPKV
jgi:hypothetical protein